MGPKITLLHGFMGDPSDWDYVCSELAEYECVTPLIRPASDWQTGVEQLIDELPERSVIVGYSMGARLSLAIALDRPDLCEALVFVSGNPGLEDEVARERRNAHDGKIADRIASEPRREFLEYWYTASVFESLTPEVRQDEIERKSQRDADDWSEILRTYTVSKQPNYWPRLGELSMPCIAIAGMQDRKYKHIIERMSGVETSHSSNIETRIVDNCGHIVHHEQPQLFLKLLKRVLRK